MNDSLTSQVAGTQQVNSQEFLTLLTTQLRYQNPFEPVSNTDFLAQLAQFSQLEESQSQSRALSDLAAIMSSNSSLQSLAQASGLIGREITYIEQTTGNELNGVVQGVRFQSGLIQLDMEGGQTVPLGNVVSISGAAGGASGSQSDPAPADPVTPSATDPTSQPGLLSLTTSQG